MRYIEHIIEPEKLLLSWQPPRSSKDRLRRFVAKLIRRGDDADLVYLSATDDFRQAKKQGFESYPGFSSEQEKHENILSSFIKRLPPRKRKDFPRFLKALRIKPEMQAEISDFAMLGYCRARLPGDDFTVIHTFSNAKPPFELLLPVQGYRYYLDNFSYASMQEGLKVNFEAEPDNPEDPQAIKILINSCLIGYVCRGLLDPFHSWMTKNYQITATVERINGTSDNPKIFVFVEVRQ